MPEPIRLVPREPQPPDENIVGQLELLLDLARQGTIRGFAYVAVAEPQDPPAVGYTVGPIYRNAAMMGAEMLLARLMWRERDGGGA